MSQLWQSLSNQHHRSTQVVLLLSVALVLVLCSCEEDISIVFMEDEKWAGNVSYGRVALNDPSIAHKDEIEVALWMADQFGARGFPRDDSLYFEGQGYSGLEELLELSQCCESAEIDIRNEDGERRVHFTLYEKENSDIEWELNLYGTEIISTSQGWQPGGEGQAIRSSNIRTRFTRPMKAVLTEKGSDLPMRVVMLLLPLTAFGFAIFFTIKIKRNRVGDSNRKSEITTELVTIACLLAGLIFVWLWIEIPFRNLDTRSNQNTLVTIGMIIAIGLIALMINRRQFLNLDLKLRSSLFMVLPLIVGVWAGTVLVKELRYNLVDFALVAWIDVILVVCLVFVMVNGYIILDVLTREPTRPARQ